MQEFMLLVRTEGDHLQELNADQQKEHLGKIMNYMGNLVKEGKLAGAQPLEMEGAMVSGKHGKFKDGPFNETKEVIAGYFLVKAENLQEACEIAKANPVFDAGSGARIEVRPIKIMAGIN